jgi:hypothetical protein
VSNLPKTHQRRTTTHNWRRVKRMGNKISSSSTFWSQNTRWNWFGCASFGGLKAQKLLDNWLQLKFKWKCGYVYSASEVHKFVNITLNLLPEMTIYIIILSFSDINKKKTIEILFLFICCHVGCRKSQYFVISRSFW